MDPTARLLRVGADVTTTITNSGIPFDGDFNKTFSADLKIKPTAFPQLLDKIESIINSDQLLPKLSPFSWSSVQNFSTYYYTKSVNNLIWAIDGMISHSPPVA